MKFKFEGLRPYKPGDTHQHMDMLQHSHIAHRSEMDQSERSSVCITPNPEYYVESIKQECYTTTRRSCSTSSRTSSSP